MVAIWKTRTLECRLTSWHLHIKAHQFNRWISKIRLLKVLRKVHVHSVPVKMSSESVVAGRFQGMWQCSRSGMDFFWLDFSNISYVNFTFLIASGVFSLGFEFLLKFFGALMGLKPGTPRFLWCGSRLQLLAPCPCGVSEILFMISWSLKFFFSLVGRLTWELEF